MPAPQRNDLTWVYLKVYVGWTRGALEYLIGACVPEVLALPHIERWFYLRYTDEDGPHLRLRLQTGVTHSAALEAAATAVVRGHLAELPSLALTPTRPSVVLTPTAPAMPASAPLPQARGRVGVRVAPYEPEAERYGRATMSAAEALFHASSQLALDVLRLEREQGLSRKTLVPLLMDATVRAFGDGGTSLFWTRYASHWLGDVPSRNAYWLSRFEAKAEQLSTRGIPVLPPAASLAQTQRELLVQWEQALALAAEAYAAALSRPDGQELAFHFAHLMNNRLGLMPLDEAYFATLLAFASAAQEAA